MQSRIERILTAGITGDTSLIQEPQSRNEELLIQLIGSLLGISADVSAKEDKLTISRVTATNAVVTLADNVNYVFTNPVTQITFTAPETLSDGFMCGVELVTDNSVSPSTVSLAGAEFIGEDCTDGAFYPEANKHYDFIAWKCVDKIRIGVG